MNMQRVRVAGLAAFALAAFALAPSAFARGHVSVGVGIALPGLSIGYSDCHHCGGRGYYGGYYGGGWYRPAYVAPAPVYYAPRRVYYAQPVVVERVYETRRVYRYDDDRYDDRYDRRYRDDDRRGRYYDDGD